MANKIKYSKEQLLEVARLKEVEGIPVKQTCKDLGYNYISVTRAMKRYGIENSKKFARRAGGRKDGEVQRELVVFTKRQLAKRKDTAVVEEEATV